MYLVLSIPNEIYLDFISCVAIMVYMVEMCDYELKLHVYWY